MDYSQCLIYLRQRINRFRDAVQKNNIPLAKDEAKEISSLAQTLEMLTWEWKE
jgi:hypothetical protein